MLSLVYAGVSLSLPDQDEEIHITITIVVGARSTTVCAWQQGPTKMPGRDGLASHLRAHCEPKAQTCVPFWAAFCLPAASPPWSVARAAHPFASSSPAKCAQWHARCALSRIAQQQCCPAPRADLCHFCDVHRG